MKKGLLKSIIGLVAITTIGISMIGCGAKTDGAGKKDNKASVTSFDDIKSKGKLVVGTSADYPPYEFHKEVDGKDTIVGFDIDIAKEVAKDLGVELEVKDMDFDGLLIALQADKVDMVFSGMTPTEERKQNVDFTDVYFEAQHTFMMKSGEETKISSIEDLKGKKIGVQKGSIQEGIAKDNFKPENIKALAKVTDLALDLKSNKIDAILVEEPVGEMFVKKNDGLGLVDFTITDEDGGCAIALKKGSDKAVAEINKTISKLKEEKKIDEFVVKANQMIN